VTKLCREIFHYHIRTLIRYIEEHDSKNVKLLEKLKNPKSFSTSSFFESYINLDFIQSDDPGGRYLSYIKNSFCNSRDLIKNSFCNSRDLFQPRQYNTQGVIQSLLQPNNVRITQG